MNKFIVVDGLPYLLANGKVYSVRWDDKGFTVGAEVEMTSVPDRTFSELSVKAKCAGNLDSIGKQINKPDETGEDGQTAPPDGNVNPDADGKPDETGADDIEKMSLAELKEYAAAHNIELGSARKKAAIVEAIRAFNLEGDNE